MSSGIRNAAIGGGTSLATAFGGYAKDRNFSGFGSSTPNTDSFFSNYRSSGRPFTSGYSSGD